MIDSKVDLPQPEGPEIETYSPSSMLSDMSWMARVSVSSVRKKREMPSSTISGVFDSTVINSPPLQELLSTASGNPTTSPTSYCDPGHVLTETTEVSGLTRISRRYPAAALPGRALATENGEIAGLIHQHDDAPFKVPGGIRNDGPLALLQTFQHLNAVGRSQAKNHASLFRQTPLGVEHEQLGSAVLLAE